MVLRGSNINPNHDNEFIKRLLAGGTAGATARTVVAPVDRIKIMLQTSLLKGRQVNSLTQSMKIIYQENGIMSFWKGNATNCSRVIPHTAVQFTAYQFFKDNIAEISNSPTISDRLLSGAFAGATAATITHPLDVIRIRLQTEKNVHNVASAFKHILNEGKGNPKNFYKGYIPTIFSLGPFIGINFATYDLLNSNIVIADSVPINSLILGGVSGFIAQSFCYPLDTIRRRMQVSGNNYSSYINACSKILHTEGTFGFYRGFLANIIKVVPNNGIRFGVFELMRNYVSF